MSKQDITANEGDAAAVAEGMHDFFGPHRVDQFVRQAIQHCWMCLPKERRHPEEFEKQVRRLVERALRDFREDREAFARSADVPVPKLVPFGGSACCAS